MKMLIQIVLKVLVALMTVSIAITSVECSVKYDETWESVDARPLPEWYDDAKFGIFIHWGVFSVPSFGSEWFWRSWKENSTSVVAFMTNNYPPSFTYQDFGRDFTAEFWNPDDWANLFAASGAKYVVLTSKHHEGYTLWPSKYSFGWNSYDVGPGRDLVGDLAKSIRNKTNLKFGLYHSLYEWYNPLYLDDKKNDFSTQTFVHMKTMPELYELIENYQPDVVWSDGEWETTYTYWDALKFIAWLFNDSPVKDTVVINDRWGNDTLCNHGDFYTCTDRYNPGVLQPHKWENAMTIDKKSWGFRRNAILEDYLTMEELVKELAETVSCGGNLLMNVGPTKEGIISPIYEERLRGMGSWLTINGEAIYGSKPWIYQNDTLTSGVWYTTKDPSVYAIVLNWPQSNKLRLALPQLDVASSVTLLGHSEELEWVDTGSSIDISFPDKSQVASNWAWVVKFNNVVN